MVVIKSEVEINKNLFILLETLIKDSNMRTACNCEHFSNKQRSR